LDIAGLGQQTTKILIATVLPLFYLILNIRLSNTPENSSEPQCLAPTSSTLRGLR